MSGLDTHSEAAKSVLTKPITSAREIKFRAWDNDAGEWIDFSDGNYFASVYDTGEFTLRHSDEISNAAIPSHIRVMQYTGLKDKNGREIYEGDIVAYRSHTKRLGERFHNREVFWDSSDAMFKMRKLKRSAGDYEPHQNSYFKERKLVKLEIVGNIYENPELLAPQK